MNELSNNQNDQQDQSFSKKVQRHVSWELFSSGVSGTLFGLAIFVFGIVRFNEWGAPLAILAMVIGILFAALAMRTAKRNYRKM